MDQGVLRSIVLDFESELREAIKNALKASNEEWWKQCIPPNNRALAESRKKKSVRRNKKRRIPLIDYLGFSDFIRIISYGDNWELSLSKIFLDRQKILDNLEIIKENRDYLMHGHDLTNDEIVDLESRFYKIEALVSNDTYKFNSPKFVQSDDIETNVHETRIDLSTDNMVYSRDAIMHITANISDIIINKPLIFQIFNSKKTLYAEKRVSHKSINNKRGKFKYEHNVNFNESKFVHHNKGTLYAKAKYGNAVATEELLIDYRKPIVRANKPVYVAGEVMVITVIDFDSNKDSLKIDHIGNRKDSKLVIKSKHGKIDGYKLRETGNSTGIFQGEIGMLRFLPDGTVNKQERNGKIINKVQGSGIDDGFMGAEFGEKIKISYKSKSGATSTTVFISGFRANIDLDKEVYHPDDVVHIAIDAPDLIKNIDKKEEIGNNENSNVTIKTNSDKLTNYRLVKTDSNTITFTGKIKLGSRFNKNSKNLGPKDGQINCKSKDALTVTLSYFGEVVSTTSLILPKSTIKL